jgi:hypothetical protein
MINKYSGITLILLALLSVLGSWMMYKKYTKTFYVSTSNVLDSQKLIRDIEIQPEAFASLKVMENIVETLSKVPQLTDDNYTIALSPVKGKQKRQILEMPSDLENKKRLAAQICWRARQMEVSMSFVADDDKYAVISDKFVREGEMVGKKYKVISIATDKIKLRKNGVNCVVKVSGVTKSLAKN